MTIKIGSRYEYSTIDFINLTPDGDAYPVVFYEVPEPGVLSYSEYTYKKGDRLDNLALKFYREPRLWWVIVENNPEIEDIQNIPEGTVLRIRNV
jgi:hypothetical protein